MANVTKPIALDETLQRVAGAMENMALGKGVDTIIADPYDATETYAVGDYVIHDGALYVCAVAIATAEAWTAAHWTEILLADEVKRALAKGGTVAVSGTTPSITGQDGIRYVCGEVSTISITPPASGIIDVVFDSGTTPAVLTIVGTVRWANGFDPTSLDADTTYEINIADGLGVVGKWT